MSPLVRIAPIILLALCAPLVACGGDGGGATADAADTDAVADGDAPATPTVVDTGPVLLDECQSFNKRCEGPFASDPDCGDCQYQIKYRADVCSPAHPCDDVFLMWAAAGCNSDALQQNLDQLLAQYPSFVMVCMQPIYPGEILPTTLGAPERDDATVRRAFARLRPGGDLAVWSGANLLMGGCSMGATRYPVVAARYDEDALWTGSAKTGVCMSDGVVDVVAQDRFIGGGTGMSCPARHRRMAHAYTVAQPADTHGCAGSPQCACDPQHAVLTYPDDCGGGDCVAFDSIVGDAGAGFAFSPGVVADDFAAPHWKLLTEGGAFTADPASRCEKDVVANPPFAGLCQLIDADDGHSCVYEEIPDAPHCGYYTAHLGEECLDWFLAL